MTSEENNEETISFFEKNNYFDYPRESIKFFKQGEMPLIGKDGEMLLDENENVKFASNGNGSIYKSMLDRKILNDMKSKNVEWIYICSVDNILLKMVEPLLLGLTVAQNSQIASKTIAKRSPEERVGVFCKKNGKISVIEYTEIPKELANMRNSDGELALGESHIMCNLFSIDALEKIASKTLPYHVAIKKVECYKDGKLLEPTEPNAYKFEQFIFDGFNFFDQITLLRGKREENFAPIKNSKGEDSPQTAIELYNKNHN